MRYRPVSDVMKDIIIVNPRIISILSVSSLMGIGVMFALGMLFTNGYFSINLIHEGWIETSWYIIIGIINLYYYFKSCEIGKFNPPV